MLSRRSLPLVLGQRLLFTKTNSRMTRRRSRLPICLLNVYTPATAQTKRILLFVSACGLPPYAFQHRGHPLPGRTVTRGVGRKNHRFVITRLPSLQFADVMYRPPASRSHSTDFAWRIPAAPASMRCTFRPERSSPLSAQRVFQSTYLLRQRGLRNVQCLGGAREFAVFRDGREVTDTTQQHGEFLRARQQLVFPMVSIINPSWTL